MRLVSLAASTAADDRLHKTMTVPVKNFMVISFVDVELLFVDDYFFCGAGHRPSSLAGGELMCVRRRQVDGAKMHATVFRGGRGRRGRGRGRARARRRRGRRGGAGAGGQGGL